MLHSAPIGTALVDYGEEARLRPAPGPSTSAAKKHVSLASIRWEAVRRTIKCGPQATSGRPGTVSCGTREMLRA
jgi:hypothetical protein